MPAAKTVAPPLKVEFRRDNTEAWLTLGEKPTFPLEFDADAVREMLTAEDVNSDFLLDEAFSKLGSLSPVNNPEQFKPLLLARSEAPVEAQCARLDLNPEFKPADSERTEDERINYYRQAHIVSIEPGMVVGTLLKPIPGKSGVDLFGKPVAPKQLEGGELEVGRGLQRSPENKRELVATIAGRLIETHQEVLIDDIVGVEGDVDFSTGSIDVKACVEIKGTVQPNFSVKTTRNLTVGGAIDAAVIDVGLDLTVLKGIISRCPEGAVVVGGSLTARYLNETEIQVGGNVCVARSSIGSLIDTAGVLRIENGSLIGGSCYARHGGYLRSISTDAHVATHFECGLRLEELAAIKADVERVEKNGKLAEQIRARVAPLMAQMKRLTREQREAATELLSKADEFEFERDEAAARLRTARADFVDAEPELVVSDFAYVGTTLRIDKWQATLKNDLRGPVSFRATPRGIVAASERSGRATPLVSSEVDLSPHRVVEEQEAAEEESA